MTSLKAPAPVAARHAVDSPMAIVMAAYLVSLNHMIINIQPLLLGAMAKDYGLTDRHLGEVSAIYIGFISLFSLTGPLWVRRVNWRVFTIVAAIASMATLAWGATLQTSAMFLFLFALLGAIKGCMGVPAFAALGDASNPDRAYAVGTILQGVMSAAAAAPLAAYIIPAYGLRGLLVTLALFYATGLLATRWLPTAGPVRLVDPETKAPALAPIFSKAALPAFIAALGLAAFMGGVLAFWYFVERIGSSRGVAPGLIGVTLSITALSSMATSALNAWLGGRVPSLGFIVAGTVTIILGYACLQGSGDISFVVANLLFALGWGFATPAFWAVLRKVDLTGRLFVAAPAASGIAGVIVGLISGPIIEAGGYDGIIATSSALMVAGCALAALATYALNRATVVRRSTP